MVNCFLGRLKKLLYLVFYVEISQLTMLDFSSFTSSSSTSSGSSKMISGLKHSETLLEERPDEDELLLMLVLGDLSPFTLESLKANANFQFGRPRRLF